MKCTLIDYGTGNIQSVTNALTFLGHQVEKTAHINDETATDVVIFPGQGAFGPAMSTLHRLNLVEGLRAYGQSARPFIGICLGFQLLFNGSDEASGTAGLGVFNGTFRRFSTQSLSVPHMGWNQIQATQTGTLLDDFNGQNMYFVHSYYLPVSESLLPVATTEYGHSFISAMADKNRLITQFHPEKSGDAGLAMLDTFLKGVSP